MAAASPPAPCPHPVRAVVLDAAGGDRSGAYVVGAGLGDPPVPGTAR
ncbi:hypothetical protein [Streptomyces sp. NPDC093707]